MYAHARKTTLVIRTIPPPRTSNSLVTLTGSSLWDLILVQVMEMLVEGPHKSRHNVLRGRLRNGRICHVSGTKVHGGSDVLVEDNEQDMGIST